MKNRFTAIGIHVCLCITLLALPYLFIPTDQLRWSYIRGNPHELSKLLAYLVMLALFYTNYYVLIPRLFFTRKYTLYILALLGGFALLMLVAPRIDWRVAPFYQNRPHVTQLRFPPPPPPDSPADASRLPKPLTKPSVGMEYSHALFLFLTGVFFTLMLRIYQQKETVAREKADAELLFLKAQINPHFLFNALNTIYSLTIREKARQSSHTVTQLSEMMRYILADSEQQFVSLRKELAYIHSYIELQKLRFGDTVQVVFTTEGDPAGKQIAPLVLITFIENAFKHGVNPEVLSEIHLHMHIEAGQLHLKVSNLKIPHPEPTHESTGIGIPLTQKRLALLYPGRHSLSIQETETHFTVYLSLPV